jgi:hypothetical protein
MHHPTHSLIVLARFPRLGQVKTRLAAAVGTAHALGLYTSFLRDILTRYAATKIPVRLYGTPRVDHDSFRAWLDEYGLADITLHDQADGDLGERMFRALQDTFSAGFSKAILTGSDLPDLPVDYLLGGLRSLATNHACLGPSRDGGYYAIGFRSSGFTDAVFRSMKWSTESVFAQTLFRFRAASLTVHSMPEWSDVDTLDDLRHWLVRQRRDSHTLRYIARHADLRNLLIKDLPNDGTHPHLSDLLRLGTGPGPDRIPGGR